MNKLDVNILFIILKLWAVSLFLNMAFLGPIVNVSKQHTGGRVILWCFIWMDRLHLFNYDTCPLGHINRLIHRLCLS